MDIARSVLLVSAGMAAGVGLVLSCGDNLSAKATADAAIDAPKVPDAAPICDCPAAEPPLAGRFVLVTKTRDMAANDFTVDTAVCPAGAYLITGSCTTDNPTTILDVTLRESGFHESPPTSWHCSFRNNESFMVTIRVTALCLKPTP
jgi:hypothetical protein